MGETQVPMVYDHCRVYVDYDAKVVVATSTYAGKTVRGIARCHPNDDFDVDLGIDLAVARCNLKVAAKRYERSQRKVREAKDAVKKAESFLEDMLEYRMSATFDYIALKDKLEDIESNV